MKFTELLSRIGFFAEKNEKPQVLNKKNYDSRSSSTRNVSQAYGLYSQEFSSLNIDNLKYYFESARLGMNFWKALLFEEIRKRDLHIGGVLQTRKRSIMSKLRNRGIEQLISSDWTEGNDFIVRTFSQSSLKFSNFLSDIIEAEIQGVSIFEKIFEYTEGKLYLKEIPMIPAHLLLYDDINDCYKFVDAAGNDAMLMRTEGSVHLQDRIDISRISTVEIIPEKLLEVHSLDGNSQNGFLNGFTDALMWCYFFKTFSLKDWSIFLELYAMPARIGKYDSLMSNRKDLADFTKAVENFGSMYWAVISKDNSIDLVDSNKTASSQVYDDFINYWDTKASIRVLGNNITTEVQKYGSNSAVMGAKLISDEIADSDILLVEGAVNTLIEDLIRLNFANPPEIPKFAFPMEKSLTDLETKSRIYVNLNSIGYRPGKEQIQEDYGFVPEEAPVSAPVIKASDRPGSSETKVEDVIDDYLNEIFENAKPK